MAKMSAKSKGYRKTVQKKPYLSKKEIITAAVIAAVVILAFVLINVFYSDGSLKVVDGVAKVSSEHSLVVNDGTGRAPRYFEVGQLADVEGYTLTAESITGDVNVNRYSYTPAEASAIDCASLVAYSMDSKLLGESTYASYTSSTNTTCSEMTDEEINGHDVRWFTFRIVPAEAAEPTIEPTVDPAQGVEETYTHVQALSAYITAGERCISLQVRNEAMSEEEFIEDSELIEVMNQVLAALTVEAK